MDRARALAYSVSTALVVDDNDLVADVMAKLLMELGFEVEFTTSSAVAMDMLVRRPVDLLLSDIKMPHMDGTELASIAKKRHPFLQVLLMSGYSENQVHRAQDLGYRVLEKPFTIDRLKAAIEEVMRNS